MDPKFIGVGVIATAALVVAVVDSMDSKTLTVEAGATVQDVAVADVAKLKPEISERICEKKWAYIDSTEATMAWFCDGAYVKNAQAELEKMAGKDGVKITLTPRQVGEKVLFDAKITNGEVTPLPEQPKVEPVKEELQEP